MRLPLRPSSAAAASASTTACASASPAPSLHRCLLLPGSTARRRRMRLPLRASSAASASASPAPARATTPHISATSAQSQRVMGDLYALDFDGVLCDSCGEGAHSALQAAKARWPSLFIGVDSQLEDWIVDQMHIVRPVLETGYENLLLVRLLLETRIPSIRTSSVAAGLTVEGILENWMTIKPVIMSEWDENMDALSDLLGKAKDEWMDRDFATWIGMTRFYPGVPDALRFASSKLYIVTTKQGRFADALLRELAGVTLPPERIYGLGTGPKVKVLKQLQEMPENQGLNLHFVEDRFATLKNVIKEPELKKWNLYLVDWGYNTPKEREEAAEISRIQLLQLSDFTNNLK